MGQPGTGVHPAAPGPQYFRASELWWEGTVIHSSRPREVKSKIQQPGKKRKKTLKIQQPATESLKTAVRCFLEVDDGRDGWRTSAGADASASEADQKLNIEGFQPFRTLGASGILRDIKPGDAFRSTGRRELGRLQCSVCQETKRFARHKGGFGKLNRGGQQTGKNENYSEIL